MKPWKVRSAIGIAVMIGAVTVTAPAAGELRTASAANAPCDPASPGGGLALPVGSAILGRRDAIREPDLGEVHENLPAVAKGKAGKRFQATVSVYVHVVTDGVIGALTSDEIAAQISVLNTTFAGGEGGARPGLTFTLAGVSRTDNADWFYSGPGGNREHTMKRTLHQGAANALNLYSTTAGVYLGWAYLPTIVNKPGQAYLDGVVINWETIPGASSTWAGRFDQGETATHEVGHWLNLEHTFFGGCNANGDFVADTPAQKVPTNGCPEGKDTCSDPGLDPIHNYMDYSYDACYTQFTAGQAQRMKDSWLVYRAPSS